MKIVLINPPREIPQIADYPPIGLLYIGAVADRQGHEIKIIDAASWSWDELINAVRDESPDMIGITCWTIERGQAFKTAHVCKQAAPEAKIVFGGPHATAFPEHMFIKAPADYVVLGEGEETFRELLEAISQRRVGSHIKGIAYMSNGELQKTPPRPFIENLDSIPLPLHDQFDYSRYNGSYDTPRKSAAIITSRGCPFRCTFCSSTVYWGNKYRKRSVANVMDEVEKLYHDHGIRALLFFDDNLTIDRNRCIALSKALISRNRDLIWAAEGTVKLDPEMLEWMKRAGCYRIDFGVESGSPEVLKNINKAFKVEDARKAFQMCRDAGIRPNAYLMIGSPGETKRTIKETVRLMSEIQPDVCIPNPGVWILPNTKIYEMSVRQGIISEQAWLTSDETFIYTGEHSKEALDALGRQFARGMALNAGILKYLRVLFFHAVTKVVNSEILGIGMMSRIRRVYRFFLKGG